jgi:hypothetical protein
MNLGHLLAAIPANAKFPFEIDVTPKVYRQLAMQRPTKKCLTTLLDEQADRRGLLGSEEYAGLPIQLEVETPRGLVFIPNPEVKYGRNGRQREESGQVGEGKGT